MATLNVSKCCIWRSNFHSFRTTRLRAQCTLNRHFHGSAAKAAVKPFLLADIGEGIKEVQIIQWFVQPGARVEQFDKLCEVQSDKAATEITSRFDGVIKKLHYEAEDMAQVGKPLCDIDILGDIAPEDEALTTLPAEQAGSPNDAQQPQQATEQQWQEEKQFNEAHVHRTQQPSGKYAALATPAVRGLLRELSIDISQVTGSGRDGRVLKDDVHKFAATRHSSLHQSLSSTSPSSSNDGTTAAQRETQVSLTPIQTQMFKTMTRSLSIPHFLYADEIDLSSLSVLRNRLNTSPSTQQKLSYLPFIIKAVSIALSEFPILNARVEIPPSESGNNIKPEPPQLVLREKINIGVAMDTPQGLLVPVIKDVSMLSVLDIASQVTHLRSLAVASKLSAFDLTGGTFTISNIGSIGGTYVSPLIVSNEVAILGIGKARDIPAFGDKGEVIRKTVSNFSWSADHRIVDGATVARAGERVRMLIEEPGTMLARMR